MMVALPMKVVVFLSLLLLFIIDNNDGQMTPPNRKGRKQERVARVERVDDVINHRKKTDTGDQDSSGTSANRNLKTVQITGFVDNTVSIKNDTTATPIESTVTAATYINNTTASRVDDRFKCHADLRDERELIKHIIERYWNDDIVAAYSCACYIRNLRNKELTSSFMYADKGIIQSIIYTLNKYGDLNPSYYHIDSNIPTDAVSKSNNSYLLQWEILGPLPVGKLEVDGDPTFTVMGVFENSNDYKYTELLIKSEANSNIMQYEQYYKQSTAYKEYRNKDVGNYILSLPRNITVYSDLMVDSVVTWQSIQAKNPATGTIDVRFPVHWNELSQSLGTAATLEFQAWSRTSTYVTKDGNYRINCEGVHTVYIRNDNITRILVGDVYRSKILFPMVELVVGVVGIVIPIRAAAYTSFTCRLEPVTSASAFEVISIDNIPNLLQITTDKINRDNGLLLSSVFSLNVQNLQSHSIVLKFQLEAPRTVSNIYGVRKACVTYHGSGLDGSSDYRNSGEIDDSSAGLASGQIKSIPLEIYQLSTSNNNSNNDAAYIPCRLGFQFFIIINPSRGISQRVPIEFTCRKQNESFLVSYVDHDGAATQSAVLFPLLHSFESPAVKRSFDVSKSDTRNTSGVSFPILLTLHGTGVSPTHQADAYKTIPSNYRHYVFGVQNYWVVAPTRFGAHNWEGLGEGSARHSIYAINQIFSEFPFLPQLYVKGGLIVAGHSMGGHGAWMFGVNNPDLSVCLSVTSGWVRKEEYGSSNAFFHLDVSNSYVDSQLKLILEMSMSEYHIDKLVQNMILNDVHIRVGSNDMVTNPYYSRRMHRLLKDNSVNSTYEEVVGKQHWWWDSVRENDGGVLNDITMRSFYKFCHTKSIDFINYHNNSVDTATIAGGHAAAFIADRCEKPFTLTLISPAAHRGMCGVRVLQQYFGMKKTTLHVYCQGVAFNNKTCYLKSNTNIRKLYIQYNSKTLIYGVVHFIIDGILMDPLPISNCSTHNDVPIADSVNRIDICWDKHEFHGHGVNPFICNHDQINPLMEKIPLTYGPMRLVYSRPLIIVFGTPNDKKLRCILKDLANYIGNSHFISHQSSVTIVTDVQYRSDKYYSKSTLHNLIFVGGPAVNRAMQKLCTYRRSSDNSSVASSYNHDASKHSHCRSPVEFEFYYNDDIDKRPNSQVEVDYFSVGEHSYYHEDDAVIFTLPLYQHNNDEFQPAISTTLDDITDKSALAICIHANSYKGYHHISRLAWPTVPPMVRSPFVANLPDFLVIDYRVWSLGLGAVRNAGYWNVTWQYDSTQSYINTE